MIIKIRTRQTWCIVETMRKNTEHLVTTGKIAGKRSGGRQRVKIIDSLLIQYGMSATEQLSTTNDCVVWRAPFADAGTDMTNKG